VGDLWYNTSNDVIYRYTFDGTSYYWIDTNGPNNGFFGLIGGTDITVDLVTISNSSTLQSVTSRGSSTTAVISITNTASSTSTTTGALTVAGGVGIGGNLAVGGTTILQQAQEVMVPVSSPGTNATLNFNSGAIFYITGMTSNFTATFVNVPTSTNYVMATSLILVQNITTAYVVNSVNINGAVRPIRWAGGTTATVTTSRTDVISITLIATGTNAYTVLASGGEYY
jgi:hypothetical protein